MPRLLHRFAGVLLSGLVALPLRAQDPALPPVIDPGAPPPGLSVALQFGVPFSRFTGGVASPGDSYAALRGRGSVQLRAAHHLRSALSAWLEAGTGERGSVVRLDDAQGFEISVKRWELLGGANLALRCLGPVCPSLDLGAGLGRRREAVVREQGTGQIVGTSPVALTEVSIVGAVRLAPRRWPQLALVARHAEGLTNLRADLAPTRIRSRGQLVGLALAFGSR
jgi:hypothetical protein